MLHDAAARTAIDAIWATGDLVGYGAEPAAVVATLREHDLVAVAGNHDLAAVGIIGVDEFNASAAEAAAWTAEHLDADARAWLAGLPQITVAGEFTLAHGSLRDPVWEYLLTAEQALVQFELQTTPYSVVGHSHIPFVFEERHGQMPHVRVATDGMRVAADGRRLIVNPGSVGQPRDGDHRASYVLYDESAASLTWHRVKYDIARAQQEIMEAGLPPWLADRLAAGK